MPTADRDSKFDWSTVPTIRQGDTAKRLSVVLGTLIGAAAGYGLKFLLAAHFPWAAHLDGIVFFTHGRSGHRIKHSALEAMTLFPCLLLGGFLGALLPEYLRSRNGGQRLI